MKKALLWFTLVVTGLVLTGCVSGSKQKRKMKLVDQKGPVPEWVSAYSYEGNSGVEALAEYKNDYCFIANRDFGDKDDALSWLETLAFVWTVEIPMSRVETHDSIRFLSETGLIETGFKKDGWWGITRNIETKKERCTAFGLYTVERKLLDEQIAALLQGYIENGQALSENENAYIMNLIATIRSNGLETKNWRYELGFGELRLYYNPQELRRN